MSKISKFYLAGAAAACILPLAVQYALLWWIKAPGVTLCQKIALMVLSVCLVPVAIGAWINLGELLERRSKNVKF